MLLDEISSKGTLQDVPEAELSADTSKLLQFFKNRIQRQFIAEACPRWYLFASVCTRYRSRPISQKDAATKTRMDKSMVAEGRDKEMERNFSNPSLLGGIGKVMRYTHAHSQKL